jgi:hypothetical protein
VKIQTAVEVARIKFIDENGGGPGSGYASANRKDLRAGWLGFTKRTKPIENLVLRFYVGPVMKITVEVADDLYRRAKSEAALRGRKLKDLVEEGLRLVLETPRPPSRRRSLAGLMEEARGVIDSGIADLATNPEHLKRFGGRADRHRHPTRK